MFDPILKDHADRYALDVVGLLQQLLGLPISSQFEIIQPNLPSGTVEADRVYRVNEPAPMLIHTEWESASLLGRPDRFLVYNTLLTQQTGLPVQTVVVLLRREANSTDMTGVLKRALPTADEYLTWRYAVVRLWELPPSLFLTSPGLTPLAPLGSIAEQDLPELARQIEGRWTGLPSRQIQDLKAATEVLMGLRFDKALVHSLFGEVSTMEESVIYQEILDKGVQKGLVAGEMRHARRSVIRAGSKRFGAPPANVGLVIEQCTNLDELDRMLDRVATASDWAAVIATN